MAAGFDFFDKLIDTRMHGIPKAEFAGLSTIAKIGLVVHSILGILCVGIVCLPFDALVSTIRVLRNSSVPEIYPEQASAAPFDIAQ
jgi:hypothetical protein